MSIITRSATAALLSPSLGLAGAAPAAATGVYGTAPTVVRVARRVRRVVSIPPCDRRSR